MCHLSLSRCQLPVNETLCIQEESCGNNFYNFSLFVNVSILPGILNTQTSTGQFIHVQPKIFHLNLRPEYGMSEEQGVGLFQQATLADGYFIMRTKNFCDIYRS